MTIALPVSVSLYRTQLEYVWRAQQNTSMLRNKNTVNLTKQQVKVCGDVEKERLHLTNSKMFAFVHAFYVSSPKCFRLVFLAFDRPFSALNETVLCWYLNVYNGL